MTAARLLQTAAALAFAGWKLAGPSDVLGVDWTLPAVGFWIFWIWTSPGNRAKTPLLLGAMAALLLLYACSQLPYLLDVAALHSL